jgi:hypothetical protein
MAIMRGGRRLIGTPERPGQGGDSAASAARTSDVRANEVRACVMHAASHGSISRRLPPRDASHGVRHRASGYVTFEQPRLARRPALHPRRLHRLSLPRPGLPLLRPMRGPAFGGDCVDLHMPRQGLLERGRDPDPVVLRTRVR